MKTNITIEARRFPLELMDERTGCASLEYIVLDKRQLQAAQMVGQSSKELIRRIYNRQGFRVLEIGTDLNLDELWKQHDKAVIN